MVLDRLPWFEDGKGQDPCLARTDIGVECGLSRHAVRISHAAEQGEITIRWSIVLWPDRTIDFERR